MASRQYRGSRYMQRVKYATEERGPRGGRYLVLHLECGHRSARDFQGIEPTAPEAAYCHTCYATRNDK